MRDEAAERARKQPKTIGWRHSGEAKLKSKAWQLLKDWKIEYCSQSELLEHREELK
jgi:hypothetical protein